MERPTHYVRTEDGFAVVFPEGYPASKVRPLPAEYWDSTWKLVGTQLVEDLAQLRAAAWEAAKLIREARVSGGCATPLGRVQTDEASLNRIFATGLAAVAAAVAAEPFAVAWVMADNSSVVHDGPATLRLAKLVRQHVAACQAASQAVRAAIEAAPSRASLQALDLAAGYPGG